MTVLATAGHVDHGKSTLVNFLTEQETDRLKEEKSRGLTINLGYTFYKHNNETISIVDVPGHRDFFKNTVAGFSNADAILFVIDSTQGWSEQSEQHFRALIGLSKLNIIFIFTKLDLPESNIDEDGLIEKISTVKGLNYSILRFNKNTTNKKDLIEDIQNFIKSLSNSYSSFWVDRSFVIDGIGRIVTGTAGENFIIDNLFLPPAGKRLEIKSIESVNKEYSESPGSQRIAISLKKSRDATPKRGDVLTNGVLQVSDHILIRINLEAADKLTRNTMKLFVGTTNKLVEKYYLLNVNQIQYAVVKLNEPTAIPVYERMILHDIDGNHFFGCEFLMPLVNQHLVRHLIKQSKTLSENNSLYNLLNFLPFNQTSEDLKVGNLFTDKITLENIHNHINENYEKINRLGIVEYFNKVFFIDEQNISELFNYFDDLSINENQIKLVEENTLENLRTLDLIYKELGNDLSVPDIDLKKFDREIVKNLFLNGNLIRVSKNILYTEEHMQRVKAVIQRLPSTFTVGQFKSESGLSRKYTIPLLEILDNKQITKKIDSDGLREKLVS